MCVCHYVSIVSVGFPRPIIVYLPISHLLIQFLKEALAKVFREKVKELCDAYAMHCVLLVGFTIALAPSRSLGSHAFHLSQWSYDISYSLTALYGKVSMHSTNPLSLFERNTNFSCTHEGCSKRVYLSTSHVQKNAAIALQASCYLEIVFMTFHDNVRPFLLFHQLTRYYKT